MLLTFSFYKWKRRRQLLKKIFTEPFAEAAPQRHKYIPEDLPGPDDETYMVVNQYGLTEVDKHPI